MGVVVVIDPGHGGENLGGHTDTYVEQELTLQVAEYMKERLMQYDDVDVYLTHDNITDPDLPRSKRAEIAKEYNADFLFSLHFNMSEYHTLYGSEVWTSAFGSYYSEGREFASIEMDALVNELGFFDRGIKTRIGKTGKDYYGIIQSGVENNIPTVIIEHCHMDESRDYQFLETNPEPYKTLGYLDADCVAKYFGLKSEALGLDYSDYQREEFAIPSNTVMPDYSDPEYCSIELLSWDADALTAQVRISAHDNDSRMQYYQLSYDYGETYDILLPWNNDINANVASDSDSIDITVALLPGEESSLTVRAFNMYDLYNTSESITLPAGTFVEEEEATEASDKVYQEIKYDINEPVKSFESTVGSYAIYVLLFIIIVSLFLVAILGYRIRKAKRRRRKRGRR